LSEIQSDEELFRSRGFGKRIGFGKSPAILVIDLINAFTDPQRVLGAELGPQVAATNQILDAAHSVNVPVIFTTVAYDDPELRDAGLWNLKQSGANTQISSGDGPMVDARLRRDTRDQLLTKKYASCFFGTDLVSRLVSQGIDTLIMTGCTTSGCVRATAVDSVQNGFRPIVVREGVGDRSQAAHAQSLFDLDAKYADVLALEEVLAHLDSKKVLA
jgi:nicotinamidase-related amidase